VDIDVEPTEYEEEDTKPSPIVTAAFSAACVVAYSIWFFWFAVFDEPWWVQVFLYFGLALPVVSLAAMMLFILWIPLMPVFYAIRWLSRRGSAQVDLAHAARAVVGRRDAPLTTRLLLIAGWLGVLCLLAPFAYFTVEVILNALGR
jgi:hypothetical protein